MKVEAPSLGVNPSAIVFQGAVTHTKIPNSAVIHGDQTLYVVLTMHCLELVKCAYRMPSHFVCLQKQCCVHGFVV
jgi:hypothetical protein